MSTEERARAIEGERRSEVTRRKRLRFHPGTRRYGAAAFARALPGGSPTDAAAAAHGTPGDRPPAVLAVHPRYRARQ